MAKKPGDKLLELMAKAPRAPSKRFRDLQSADWSKMNTPIVDQTAADKKNYSRALLASVVGLPADIANLVLRDAPSLLAGGALKAMGREQTPLPPFIERFGTSEWIANKLGADPDAGSTLAGLIGIPGLDDLGRLGATKAIGGGSLAQSLFHGTPHKFDKFSLDAIGTGEGAQAYGHGLYFAENKGVAGSYQKTLSGTLGNAFDHKQIIELLPKNMQGSADNSRQILNNIDGAISRGEIKKAGDYLSEYDVGKELEPAYRKAADLYEKPGHLYEVDLPDETVAKMLDWDAPLSEQPESVRKALQPIMAEQAGVNVRPNGPVFSVDGGGTPAQNFNTVQEAEKEAARRIEAFGRVKSEGTRTAESLYRDLSKRLGSDEAASKAMLEQGIPGIRFYDGSSRSAQQGTRNIVVFNPDDIRQVKRDGQTVFSR